MLTTDPETPQGPPLNSRTLRQFAGALGVLGGLILGLSGLRHGAPSGPAWALGVAALVFAAAGLAWPRAIRLPYALLLNLTRPIGHVVGLALLGLVFLLVILPVGRLLRLKGWDPLGRRAPEQDSYWSPHRRTTDLRRYLRQYQPTSAPAGSAVIPGPPSQRVRTTTPPSPDQEPAS
jgi:hypothetical protein